MALYFSLEQMARLRVDARHLAEHAAETESDLNSLLAHSGGDSPATQRALRALCVEARQQHVAIERLVIDLGDHRPAATADKPRPRAVLVVDDHQDSREWITLLLQNAGFIVRTAGNGLEAVLAAHQLQPAVILMDLTMPVLGGVEAARLIKAIDGLRDARVIAYTAQAIVPPPRAEGLFAAVLPKPSPPQEILAMVQRCAGWEA
jgi:CheY-like chemotaxis protein